MPQNLHWEQLAQEYATRARLFSEAVAKLGRHRDVGPETVALWQEIKELRTSCIHSEREIDRHLGLDERRYMSAGGIDDSQH